MKKRKIIAWVYVILSLVLLGVVAWLQGGTYVVGKLDFDFGHVAQYAILTFTLAAMSLTLFIIGVKEINLLAREKNQNIPTNKNSG